jgi:hypothetical protein
LTSRKNCRFYKTNHPGKGNNGALGGLIANPIGIPTTFLAYMARKTEVAGDLAMTHHWLANSRDAIPTSPAPNQALCEILRSFRSLGTTRGGPLLFRWSALHPSLGSHGQAPDVDEARGGALVKGIALIVGSQAVVIKRIG